MELAEALLTLGVGGVTEWRTLSAEALKRAYLKQVRVELESSGIPTECQLAFGEPAREIIKWVDEKGCDLVAMGTHGHKLVGDLFFGATASKVQHNISVPVLLLRVP